jgi:hypothetical protein
MRVGELIPITKIKQQGSVPAGKAPSVEFGVIRLSMKVNQPKGDTSKPSHPMPKYKTIPGQTQGTGLSESKYPLLRKPLESEPLTYNIVGYHATSPDYWKSIRRSGLIPGKNKAPGQSWDAKWKGKATYFHLDFPAHELDNGVTPDGEFFVLVIEARMHGYPGYFVPDEDVNMDVNYTPKAIKNKEAIAYGYIVPPREFIAVHLPDVEEAHAWAKENCKGFTVKFHKVA